MEAPALPAYYCSVTDQDLEHIAKRASFSRAANSEPFANVDFV